jgi:ATP-dependent Lon protease
MPKANEKDLRDVPDEVKKNMNFMFVDRMDEVLHLALLRPVTNELADHIEGEATTVITPGVSPADRAVPAAETVIGSD